VVLPMLLTAIVPKFVTEAQFLEGFALAQAIPGPVFNFSAFLGGCYAGLGGAVVAWLGLFAPGFLLIHAALPFWQTLRSSPAAQISLRGVNAAASGLVIAAVLMLYRHVSTGPQQAIAIICYAVHHWIGPQYFGPKLNAPLTVLLGASLGVPFCAITGACG